jgi:hypothetical protein
MKAYIVLQCISGLGDQYSSVLSGHTTYRDLTALGYDTEVIFPYNTFHSSFLTYGITHNIHHKNWNTKLKDLIYE